MLVAVMDTHIYIIYIISQRKEKLWLAKQYLTGQLSTCTVMVVYGDVNTTVAEALSLERVSGSRDGSSHICRMDKLRHDPASQSVSGPNSAPLHSRLLLCTCNSSTLAKRPPQHGVNLCCSEILCVNTAQAKTNA